MKLKDLICKDLLNYTQIIMYKDWFKGLNVVNVKNRHLRDVQNVKVFGIVQNNVKFLIGQNINKNVMKNAKQQNKPNKNEL